MAVSNCAAAAPAQATETADTLYFGCVGSPGHFLWESDSRWARVEPRDWPASLRSPRMGPGAMLDGRYAPGCVPDPSLPAWKRKPTAQVDGAAALHHVDGWTVLASWDRSVDSRGGSNSVFVIRGTHDYEGACKLAEQAFPKVWERIRGKHYLAQDAGGT